jgi:putative transposase
VLVSEELKIANMTRSATRNPRGTLEHPGSRVAQKASLNREILAASWGGLIGRVAYRASQLILVNPRDTSRRCSACGHTEAANRRSQAEFCCLACRFGDHADRNAARNILWLGSSLRRQKREGKTSAA